MGFAVRLDDTVIEAAGALVAREQVAARQVCGSLPAAYEAPETCTAALQQLRDGGHIGGVVLERGRPLAVLTFVVRDSYAFAPAEGLAIDPDLSDPTTVVARLYAELAPELVAAGVLQHVVDHVPLAPVGEALSNLTFGRHHIYAGQRPDPHSRDLPDVEIRRGGVEDLDSVAHLALVEIRHRATPPIYSPPGDRPLPEVLERHRALHDRGGIHFIAAVSGRDVGLLTVEPSSPAPRLCSSGQPFIGPTVTAPDMRGQGIGTALVDAALNWAHSRGHRWVSVDFESANPLSRPFWFSNGFRPTGYGVLRSIDLIARALG